MVMRLCSGPGCGRAIPEGTRLCSECGGSTPTIREHTNLDGVRLGHLYSGPRWKVRVQPSVLRRDPFCKRCDIALSTLVDHIVPSSIALAEVQSSGRFPLDPWAGFYLMSNLRGLCRGCHNTKTLEDKAHVGPWPSVLEAYDRMPKKIWSFG